MRVAAIASQPAKFLGDPNNHPDSDIAPHINPWEMLVPLNSDPDPLRHKCLREIQITMNSDI